MPADALEQFSLAALLALFPRGNADFVGLERLAGLREVLHERPPEFLYGCLPGKLAFLDFVEFIFQARGEAHVKNVFKTFYQEVGDFFSEQSGGEAALVLVHVLAFDDGRDDRGVGGRASDAFFFEFFYQRRFRVAWRRLGEVLVGANLFEAQFFANSLSERGSVRLSVSPSSSFSSSSLTIW